MRLKIFGACIHVALGIKLLALLEQLGGGGLIRRAGVAVCR